MGLQLDDFFTFSEECINSNVFMINDIAYYSNNKTLSAEEEDEYWLHTFLNLTGLVGGPASEIIPNCYQFSKSVKERETDRWQRFNKSWGNFALAFLFNQMGNALNFQQKF